MSESRSPKVDRPANPGRSVDREAGLELLAFSDLAEKGVPFSRQHIARLIKCGRFPAPIKLGTGTNRWIAAEVANWLSERKAERDAALEVQRRDR